VGDWSRRFDLCYLALKLIVEYDGEQHGDLEHRDGDIHRREQLERLGFTLVPVTSLGIYRDPATTLRRVSDALRTSGGPTHGHWRPE
jgi:very-short-patch-repair endonuclease